MANVPQSSNGTLLNSWKEIANYLGRGVRTVQRYERELGLPVRRPHGTSRSAVIALTEELDEWLRIAPKLPPRQAVPAPAVVAALRKSVLQTAELRRVCSELRAENEEALRTLYQNLQNMQELLRFSQRAREELTGFREQGFRRPDPTKLQ